MSSRKRDRLEQTSHKVIEKRRRDRINNCLFELSQTVPAAFSKQTSGKLEKAEILEMTVDYLRAVQTTEIGMRFDNGEWFSTDIWGDFAHHYQAGYNECVREVLKYMADVEGIAVSDTRCARLVSFLHNRFRSDTMHTASPSAGSSLAAGSGHSGIAGARGTYGTGSRNGVFHGNGGIMLKTSRDLTVLDSGVKTVSSTVSGNAAACFETRLLAFPPFLPPSVSGSCSGAGEARPPLHPSTTFSTLNVVPSSPFRPLPSLAIPAMDLRFPPYAREAGSSFLASNGTVAGTISKDALSVDLHPGLSAAVRKETCSSI